jgi:hypothetical protein
MRNFVPDFFNFLFGNHSPDRPLTGQKTTLVHHTDLPMSAPNKRKKDMKTGTTIAAAVGIAAVAAAAVYMIDIDQTQEGALPDVDIAVEGGQLPEFDAEVGTVSLGETQVEVETPEVKVITNTETITVPTLSVDAPGDANDS